MTIHEQAISSVVERLPDNWVIQLYSSVNC